MAVLATAREKHISFVEKWDIWRVIVQHKRMVLEIVEYILYVDNLYVWPILVL